MDKDNYVHCPASKYTKNVVFIDEKFSEWSALPDGALVPEIVRTPDQQQAAISQPTVNRDLLVRDSKE